jgi:hypothetical protein
MAGRQQPDVTPMDLLLPDMLGKKDRTQAIAIGIRRGIIRV